MNVISEIDATNQEEAMIHRKKKPKSHAKKTSKSRQITHRMGVEMRDNPPRIIEKTRREKGDKAAEKQRRAILLSKARRAGAKIPKKKSKRKRTINKR
jgi:hypothetical protein